MKDFNLSDWALEHRSFVWFLMLVSLVAGVMAYTRLGREEDPPFTIKTMVVQTAWPGATIKDTLDQVTDRVEKELQQLNGLDYVRSYTTPGSSTVFVQCRDTLKKGEVQPAFYQVRKRLGDIKGQFPEGVQGPFFNDEFGDVYGNIYAFTADGLTHRQLRDYVESIRTDVLQVPDIGKTQLIGTQAETIYLDFSTRKLAGYGIDFQALIKALQAQNAVSASGVVQAGPERVSLRVSWVFRVGSFPARFQPAGQRPILPSGRHRGDQPRLRGSAGAAVPGRRQARDRARHRHAAGGEPAPFRRGPEGAHAPNRGEAAGRRRRPPRLGPAEAGGARGRRLHPGPGRGRDHRARREFRQPRRPGRPRRVGVDPAGPGDCVCGHADHGRDAAADLARRPDHCPRSAGRRCHDHRRDDGGPAGARRHAPQRRDLRVHLDCVSRC